MQLRLTTLLFFFFLTGLSNHLLAQAKFTATINPGTIGKDEVAELKLMVENAGTVERINPPSFSSFIVVSGPNQESGMESINGVTRQYIGISYLLKPKYKGDFTIGAAVARADGKDIRSNPVKLKVVNGTTGNSANRNSPFSSMLQFDEPQEQTNYTDFVLKKGENVQDKISKNLFIKVYTDKTSCFIGEPVVVTYKLYTRLKSESNIVKNPSFNGFSVIDLVQPQSAINYAVEKLNGRDYNVYTLRKVQLYPLQAGVAELESAVIENAVHFIKAEYLQSGSATDMFGELIPGALPKDAMLDEMVTIESKPVAITVKPLPEAGKPASFNGAVGNFMVDAVLDKDSLTTDDAGKLKFLLSGDGNLTLIPAPEIAWPAGLEGYEPTVKDGLNKASVPVSGSKIFDYPFTFAAPGTYVIPAVEFGFFDNLSGKYKTVSTKPITVNVKKGTGKKQAIVLTDNRGRKESFFEMIFTKRWMIVVPVALLIIGGLLIWLWADKKKQQKAVPPVPEEAEVKIPTTVMLQPLQQTEQALLHNDVRNFYATLNTELYRFFADKLQLPPEQLGKRAIADGLDKAGVSVVDSFAVQKLLEDISLQLYTPMADENKMQDDYVEAMRLVNLFKA